MAFSDSRSFAGVTVAEVVRRERITPHMVRVTLGGEAVRELPARGYDQWGRLFLPRPDGPTDFAAVPQQFGLAGYLRYLAARSGTRPPFRNYTIRELRPAAGELDIDFVAHGEQGIAGPWAQRAQAGEQVAFIDQGRGFDPAEGAERVLLVGDESALPAILGILRDLDPATKGLAIVEIPHADDAQQTTVPAGVELRWIVRAARQRPGSLALEALCALRPERSAAWRAYLAGEQALVTEGRRHLVAAGMPKAHIAFTGYWRIGRTG